MASFLKNLLRRKTPLRSNRSTNTLKNNTRKVNAMLNPMLLKRQLDLDLLQAVQTGSVSAAIDALEKGANPNAMTVSKTTPLFLVIINKDKYSGNSFENRANLVNILLEKGANIHQKKQYGKYDLSPLQLAALNNDVDILEVLLKYEKYNSNMGKKNIANAYDIAEKRGHSESMLMLYTQGRKNSKLSDPGLFTNDIASDPGSVGGAKRKTRRRRRAKNATTK